MEDGPMDAGRREAMERLGYPAPPETVERLAAVTARGNSVAALAGEGSGIELLYGLAAAERCDGDSPAVQALALTSTPEGAMRIARAFHMLAAPAGLDALAWLPWRQAEEEGGERPFAQLLAGRPRELLPRVRAGHLQLSDLKLLAIDDVAALEEAGDWDATAGILDTLPAEAQKIVCSTERTATFDRLLTHRLGRARRWPPELLAEGKEPGLPGPGAPALHFAAASSGEARFDRLADGLRAAAERSDREGATVHCPDERSAHHVAASLAARGFALTADPEEPGLLVTWGEEEPPEGVAALWGLPRGLEELEVRLGRTDERIVALETTRVPQLRILARRAGWRLESVPEGIPGEARDEIRSLRDRLRRRIEEEGDAPELLLLEPLFEEFGSARVAAAASSLLRRSPGEPEAPGAEGTRPSSGEARGGRAPEREPRPREGREAEREAARHGGWFRLYINAGERDDVGPSDLVGAITGETSLVGGQIGEIQVRRSYSLVDVQAAAADEVIEKLTGAQIKGREVVARPDRKG